MKTCTKCKTERVIEEFDRAAAAKDGRRPICKECGKARKREYYLSKREDFLEKARIYREANKENIAEYLKGYARQNAEVLSEYQKQYRAENKERLAAADKAYVAKNPGKARESAQRYKMRKINAYSDLPSGYWINLVKFYTKCLRCDSKERLTHDHGVPLSWGGSHTYINSQVLCFSCNTSKRNFNGNDYRDWSKGVLIFTVPSPVVIKFINGVADL